MSSNPIVIEPEELLRRAFPVLDDEEVAFLVSKLRVETYPPETVLCHEGVREDIFYLVSAGMTVIYKRLNDEEDLILRYCGAGEFFGEMAIIQEAPRAASVRTTEETTVLEFDKNTLQALLNHNAQMALAMMRITFDRHRMNDQNTINNLRQSYDTLAKLDRAKLDFIEVTAHELRTPLTIMRGYASILAMDGNIQGNSMLTEIVEGIVSGTNRLHEVVNNMLDIQRIDMNQIKLSKAPVSLAVVLKGIEQTLQSVFAERHLKFILDLGDNTDPIYIEADSGLLHKAFQQIVLNAVKYTPDNGSIKVTLRYVEHDLMETAAHIMVQDTGIGIDPEHHKLIFEKFYRLGAAATHSSGKTAYKAGGPGLGLAISHGAVMAHGGQIWVESDGYSEETFPGTTFHIVLPMKSRVVSHSSGNFGRMDRE